MAETDPGYVELEWTCPSCNARSAGSATRCEQCEAGGGPSKLMINGFGQITNIEPG